MNFHEFMDDRVGSISEQCSTQHNLLSRHPQSSAGPQRLPSTKPSPWQHEARSATKGKGVPLPRGRPASGADGMRSGPSRRGGRSGVGTSPGGRRWARSRGGSGQTIGRRSGPRRRTDSAAAGAVGGRPGPSVQQAGAEPGPVEGPRLACRGPRSRQGDCARPAACCRAAGAAQGPRLRRTRADPRGRQAHPRPGRRRPRGPSAPTPPRPRVPPAAPATSGRRLASGRRPHPGPVRARPAPPPASSRARAPRARPEPGPGPAPRSPPARACSSPSAAAR